jgi:hypothetical protein
MFHENDKDTYVCSMLVSILRTMQGAKPNNKVVGVSFTNHYLNTQGNSTFV